MSASLQAVIAPALAGRLPLARAIDAIASARAAALADPDGASLDRCLEIESGGGRIFRSRARRSQSPSQMTSCLNPAKEEGFTSFQKSAIVPRTTRFRRIEHRETTSLAAMSQISIAGVKHVYRPARGRAVPALDDVSLEIGARELVALLGPSGCGKSTLLYLIGGFLPREGGSICVDGKPVPSARARPRHRVPAFRAVSLEDRARATFSMGWSGRGCRARSARRALRPSSIWSGSRASRTAIPRSSPAA